MGKILLPLKRPRFAQLGPLTMISFGIIVSFISTAVLAWLIACILNGFV